VAIPNYQASNTIAYIRGALGHEGDGPFVQLMAASLGLQENSSHFDTASAAQYGFPPDLADSVSSLSQYVATAGFDKWGGRLRLTDRYRTQRGVGYNSLGATFDLSQRFLSVSALAEHDNYYGFTRLEAGARFAPVSFLAFAGYVGQRNADTDRNGQPNSRSARIDAGVRLTRSGLWLSGGVLTRDTTLLVPPIIFDSSYRAKAVGPTTGATLALMGPLKYGFSVDAWGVAWSQPNAYTPKYQARGELRFYTQWLSKFPSGNFSFLLAPRVEYRGSVDFPTSTGDQRAAASTVVSVLAELRILRGVITFERQNLNTVLYEEVPGFLMPRSVTVYGVRWYFFN
jgi:hypothetical protein